MLLLLFGAGAASPINALVASGGILAHVLLSADGIELNVLVLATEISGSKHLGADMVIAVNETEESAIGEENELVAVGVTKVQ